MGACLSDRVAFTEESALGTTRGPVDLVLCVGSGHALTEAPGDFAGALRELRRLVAPAAGCCTRRGSGSDHRPTPSSPGCGRTPPPTTTWEQFAPGMAYLTLAPVG